MIALTGKPPITFIKEYRLDEALLLLKKENSQCIGSRLRNRVSAVPLIYQMFPETIWIYTIGSFEPSIQKGITATLYIKPEEK